MFAYLIWLVGSPRLEKTFQTHKKQLSPTKEWVSNNKLVIKFVCFVNMLWSSNHIIPSVVVFKILLQSSLEVIFTDKIFQKIMTINCNT